MKRPTWTPLLYLVFVFGVFMLMSACGGAAPTPIPTPTPTMTPQEVRGLLTRAALGFADLPQGYELAGQGSYVSNEEAATNSVLGQAVLLPKFDEWGRILGYGVSYTRGRSRFLGNIMELYKDNAGAKASAEYIPPGYSTLEEYFTADFANALGLDPSENKVSVTQISFPSLGDLSNAFKGSIEDSSQNVLVEVFVACEVSGRFYGCVFLIDIESEASTLLEELEAVARAQGSKLKESA